MWLPLAFALVLAAIIYIVARSRRNAGMFSAKSMRELHEGLLTAIEAAQIAAPESLPNMDEGTLFATPNIVIGFTCAVYQNLLKLEREPKCE